MQELLRIEGVTKTFPGVKALDAVDLSLGAGEIVALLGENGAGKSTLMKILSGITKPDAGSIIIDGKEVHLDNPEEAKRLGIGIVFQELSLADNLTVAQNIYALSEPKRFGLVNFRLMNSLADNLMTKLGFDVEIDQPVSRLSLADQQLVEIAKVLRWEPRILILDEPTSALSEREVERLFSLLEELKGRGTGTIFITHKMDEVYRLSDRVTVLRDGHQVGNLQTKGSRPDQLVGMMVGRPMEASFPARIAARFDAPPVLVLEDLHREGWYEHVSFTIRAGEIVGLYGLVGAGRTELVQGIFGVAPPTSGRVILNGITVHIGCPAEAVMAGIAYVTEDRKHEGLILDAPVTHNTTMASLSKISDQVGIVSRRREREITERAVRKFRIKTPSIDHIVGMLSGGNQQKVVLAKWIETAPRILILDEPTRGIDVVAKYEIYLLMQEFAKRGVGILMISSELPEILNVANRVLVVKDHRIVAEVDPSCDSADTVMSHIVGSV